VISVIREGNPQSPNLMPWSGALAICGRTFLQHQVNKGGSRSTQSNYYRVTVPPQTLILRPIPKGTAKRGILPQCRDCHSSSTLSTHVQRPAASTCCIGLFIYHWVKLLFCNNEVMGSNPENSLWQKKCREMLHTKDKK
jgi:hypothetical protein